MDFSKWPTDISTIADTAELIWALPMRMHARLGDVPRDLIDVRPAGYRHPSQITAMSAR